MVPSVAGSFQKCIGNTSATWINDINYTPLISPKNKRSNLKGNSSFQLFVVSDLFDDFGGCKTWCMFFALNAEFLWHIAVKNMCHDLAYNKQQLEMWNLVGSKPDSREGQYLGLTTGNNLSFKTQLAGTWDPHCWDPAKNHNKNLPTNQQITSLDARASLHNFISLQVSSDQKSQP